MNNIYVDELPETMTKSSSEDDVNTTEVRMWFKSDVKISSLSDRLTEERKKMVQEIKDKISNGLYRNSYGETFIDGDIYEILDQIEGGKL